MKTLIHIVYLFLGSILFSSCLLYKKVDFNNTDLKINKITAKSIDIAFLDERKLVINKGKKPCIVGYYSQVPVYTSSNKNFIDDVSNILHNALIKQNIKSSVIKTEVNESSEILLNKLLQSDAEKKIYFRIHQFNTEGQQSQTLFYHITIKIYNQSGALINQNSYNDYLTYCAPLNNLGHSRNIRTYIPYLVSTLLSDMINKPEILNAINE